ncbi:hypothetical protein D3C87_1279350 [compost metagenome]
MRRHDLHAVLVEHVLNIGVKHAQQHRARTWLARDRLGDQPVFGVEIRQSGLEHLRRRVLKNSRCALRGFQQHRFDLAPGCVVADRHHRIDDITRALYGARVVFGDGTGDHRVGQSQHFTETGADPRGEHAQFGDGAFIVANLDELAGAQGARVGQDQTGGGLPDNTGRAKRNHQANQYRQALECIGAGPRQVGIGHGQGKQPDRQRGQALRRLQGFVIKPAECPWRCHAPQNASGKRGDATGDKENRQCHAQSGNRPDNALQ